MSTVGGRYEVLGTVAEGGEGSVARARDRRDGSLVALKFLPPDSKEGSVLTDVSPHPALPRVISELRDGGRAVLVMDWIDGTDLGRMLDLRGSPGLPVLEAVEYLEQASAALDHLHAHEPPVVHGDVKPANLIVDDQGRLHLVDFGIATGARGDRGALGTPGYRAPEVAAGSEPLPASDVCGLAATAVALLSGAPPGERRFDLSAAPPRARPEVERVLRAGLSIDPGQRPQSAGALVASLTAALVDAMPTGEVSVVAYAIDDEAALWTSHPDVMPRVVSTFGALAREVIERHDGIVASKGDPAGDIGVFERADDASAAATDLAGAVAHTTWPAGIALAVRTATTTGAGHTSARGYEGAAIDACRASLRRRAPDRVDAASSSSFLGRREQLAELEDLIAQAREGRGALAVVSGEAGIGKTRLLEELAASATRQGLTSLWGLGYERGAPAYSPWLQVLRSYIARRDDEALRRELGTGAAVLAEVVPEIRQRLPQLGKPSPAEPDAARFRLFDAVSQLLSRATEATPLLIVLDDLHWADRSTIKLLEFLLPTISESGYTVVVSHRPTELIGDEAASALVAGLEAKAAVAIELSGLEDVDVTAHANRIAGGALPAAVLDTITRQAAGNPLFAGELARLLQGEPHATGETSLEVPDTVRAVVTRRVELLGTSCAALLTAAAVLGQEFDVDLLVSVAGVSPASVERELGRATDSGVLTRAGPSHFRFTHPLLRETLYDGAAGAHRAELHRRAGEGLLAVHASPDERIDEVAYHFTEGVWGKEIGPAAQYARQAGEHAEAQHALDEAGAWFRRAIEVLDLGESSDLGGRAELLLALARVQQGAGDRRGAHSAVLEAVEAARRVGGAELLGEAALRYGASNQGAGFEWGLDRTLIGLLEEALEAVGPQPTLLRANLLGRLSAALFETGDAARMTALTDEAITVAKEIGDPHGLSLQLRTQITGIIGAHRLDERVALCNESIQLAMREGDEQMELYARWGQLANVLELGDMDAFDENLVRISTLVADPRFMMHEWWTHQAASIRAMQRGAFEEMERSLQEMVDRLSRTQASNIRSAVGAHVFLLSWHRGRLERLRDITTKIAATEARPIWRACLGVIHVEAGRTDDAHALVEQFVDRELSTLSTDGWCMATTAVFGYLSAEVGDAERSSLIYERLLPYDGRTASSNVALAFGAVAGHLGKLAAAMGRTDDARCHYEDALVMHDRMGERPMRARFQESYARMLLSTGDDDDVAHAERLLDEAIATADEIGMPRVAAQARELRSGVE